MFGRNALSIRRLTAGGMLLILMLAVISLGFLLFTSPASAGPGAGALYETRLLVWNGSAWVKVTKGQLVSLHNTATDATIGGGYGSTGATISSAGVIQANGAITTDGALTAEEGVFGGGYASGSGTSIYNSGNIQATGDLTIDGNVTIGASKVTVAGTTGNTAVQGTLGVYDAFTATTVATVTNATDTIGAVTTATYYGKTVFLTHATGGTVTLPDAATAGAGKWLRFVLTGDDNLAVVFQESGADDIIAPNNTSADSVTFGAGHRIGATVKFLSNGANWIAINENAGCTMTVTDAD